MKVAFTNSSNRLVAGAERYIENAASFLRKAGHETALWHENETPADRQAFSASIFLEQHCLEEIGLSAWIDRLEQWKPDLIFGHGLYDPRPEAETLKVAPSVFFVHNYHGTCISGQKCHMRPRIEPCSRRFGPACLAMFYPRRCGGLNPATLIKDYGRTSHRLKVIGAYGKVITHTRHMEVEYRNNGICCEAIYPYAIADAPGPRCDPVREGGTWNLLFIGRMVELKGGNILLDSLPVVARRLPGGVKVRFAGDGPAREAWERRAADIERENPTVKIEFPGWLSGERMEAALADAHLHVVPSLWPEPFGLSGLQLGLKSIPTVAFKVGGIPDWLHDQVNGVLADCCEPLDGRLADAIVAALRDEGIYRSLCSGALRVASSMTMEKHCASLVSVLEQASMHGAAAGVSNE